jgi:hypothetical protein
MATPQAAIDTTDLDQLRLPLSTRLWQLIRKQPLGAAGAFIVIIMVVAATFANVLTPYDPVVNNLASMLPWLSR